MPKGLSSSPRDLVKLRTYALVAEYTVSLGFGANDAIEQVLTIYAPLDICLRQTHAIAVNPRQFKSTIDVWV